MVDPDITLSIGWNGAFRYNEGLKRGDEGTD